MDYKTTIERIQAIEKAMDVTAIRYKGLHLWPLVRMQLWQRLLHPDKYAPPAAIGLKRLANKLSEGFFRPDFYAPYLEHAKRHRSNLSELSEFGPVDILLYSREKDHEDQIGGRYYNRHIDPMIDLIKTRYTFLKLELITDRTDKTLPRFEHTHFFDSLDYLRCDAQRSVIAAFQESPNIPAIEQGRTLTQLLAGTRFDLALTEEYLMMESERVLHYIRYFKEMLTATRPKAVFFVNYYDNIGMALITACKSLGITTVDLQSNRQGKHHGMYSSWNSVPEGGYEMLPDVLWCWGKKSVENIKESQPENKQQQRAVIGGNAWLAKWIDRDPAGFVLDEETSSFIDKVNAYQKVILVTLQKSDLKIPKSVIEAMRKAPTDWYWLIRLHPDQRAKVLTVEASLTENHIDNADVVQSTRLPLYLLLRTCHRHLTRRSSVALEGLRFNVPSVIFDASGATLYKEYIDQGHFAFAKNAEQIIDALYEPMGSLVEDPPYVETSRMYATDALSDIMSNAKRSVLPQKRVIKPVIAAHVTKKPALV
ncbi:MAG: hypothetical protein AB8G77_10515 [Rhodothermales bacterium]